MKYFTPQIEDIRVGYECELAITRLKPPQPSNETYIEGWYETTILNLDLGLEFLRYINEGMIRTPYLTEEQIEAEGWILIAGHYFRKGKYELDFLIDGYGGEDTVPYTINIGEDLYYPSYNGQCKSINEFRTICKWLKI